MTTNPMIFVHIPRTAGSSIGSLTKQLNIVVKGHNIHNKKHIFYYETKECKSKIYPSFSVIRNPWERAVSSFFYLNNGGLNKYDLRDKQRYIQKYNGDFKAFIKNEFVSNKVYEQLHFIPQYKWITDLNGNIVIGSILKYESLNNDFNDFLQKNNRRPVTIPIINGSKHVHYPQYYDKETIEIIRNVYQQDIILFDYEFD
ncbi:sulfotransferase family 2 domain-containing protein [Sinomicrobium weinanense]|uniref:Sulfotransferase family 2 domain-containing protein n=1 Tax=Sinomicrobium weinanense TaxID=2842200 RepID=A0A926Q537_9FLAO|nr:sulfotransferase family 2 domain-containing protein [Sinomicrobium weinanense]MBC9798669.1 sulfotransferase family 2 domain-containing protein [Sinomicrobium weinanense]MBU3126031.1 sulfotransferase family protein [Sinomicrobium weinanense]